MAVPDTVVVDTHPTRAATRADALDEARFGDVYRAVSRPLWSYLRRMTDSPALADDLLQETFTRLLVQAHAPEGDAALRAWLFRVATNLAIDAMRRGKREVPAETVAEAASPSSRDERPDPLLAREMGRAFGTLESRERALLWLAYVEDAPHRDIAGALGVKESSVRVLLFRARKKLAGVFTRRREERSR